jgi:hypothetical protein
VNLQRAEQHRADNRDPDGGAGALEGPRIPLAVPASRGGTDLSTKSVLGAMIMPLPSPATNSGATRYQPSARER